jgi:hypothetical protein
MCLPTNGTTISDNTPTFDWNDVADNSVIYELQVDNDANFSSPLISQTGLTSSNYTPTITLVDNSYFWRVRAKDAANNISEWSTVWTFTIDTTSPDQVTMCLPTNGTTISDNTPTFDWNDVADNSVIYELQVDNDADFSSPEILQTGLTSSGYISTTALVDNSYFWRVRAKDAANNISEWSTVWTFVISTMESKLADYLTSQGIPIYSVNITSETPPHKALNVSYGSVYGATEVYDALSEITHVCRLAYSYLFDTATGEPKLDFSSDLTIYVDELRVQAGTSTGMGICQVTVYLIPLKVSEGARDALLQENLIALAHQGAANIKVGPGVAETVSPPADRLGGVELLVFVSPQYASSSAITEAVENYCLAVKQDIGWDTEVINLTETTNSVGHIREIIKNKYQSDGIYAALIIGEDTKTALVTDSEYEEAPSIALWSAFNDDISWMDKFGRFINMSPGITPAQIDTILAIPCQEIPGVITPQVAVALLYPTATNSYDTKVEQISAALSKFSTNRGNIDYGNKIHFFVNTSLCSTDFVENYNRLGTVTCTPTTWADATFLYNSQIKLLGAIGHGWTGGANGLMTSDVEHINVPLLMVSGCWTNGWCNSDGIDDNVLDPPAVAGWLGEQAITHPNVSAVIAGSLMLPPEVWDSYDALHGVFHKKLTMSFNWYGWAGLSENRTLAEAMIEPNLSYFVDNVSSQITFVTPVSQQIIFGDPTFHYGTYPTAL